LSCLLCVCRGPPFCQEDSLMLHVFHAWTIEMLTYFKLFLIIQG
jgi:hypothetical protein